MKLFYTNVVEIDTEKVVTIERVMVERCPVSSDTLNTLPRFWTSIALHRSKVSINDIQPTGSATIGNVEDLRVPETQSQVNAPARLASRYRSAHASRRFGSQSW